MKCKYRKDDDEVYKTHYLGPVEGTLDKPSENLEVCGVCGNPDIVGDDNDDSFILNWIQCEVCFQWFHQDCLGYDIDSNDFICSEDCEKKAFTQSKKKISSNNNTKNIKNNTKNMKNNNNTKNIENNNNTKKSINSRKAKKSNSNGKSNINKNTKISTSRSKKRKSGKK